MVSVFKGEIIRKTFHFLSLVYVFGYWYLHKILVVFCLIITIIIVILWEYLRFKIPVFNNFFTNNFKSLYRPSEVNRITGLVWTLSGALITILVFTNRYMVFASFLYLVFGDAVAALIGTSFGKHKIFAGKSLEGSLACCLVCFAAGLFLFNLKFAIVGAIVAMLVEMFVEAIPLKLNDNFYMQIINAGILTMLSNIMMWTK
ncbi:MAG: hypothetical protein LBU29_03920 [Endomicrobium sp.]|jgi:dolichol kinase|nr:hypothetical protein [Endomicrobium sp.]